MEFKPATRISSLPPYPLQTISQRIGKLTGAGHDIIRFDIGSPDLPPPPHVIETLAKCAWDKRAHGYTGYRGNAKFRDAVAHYYADRHAVNLDPNTQVMPLMGSKEGLYNMSMAFVEPGDVVLVPEFSYAVYDRSARIAGGEIVYVPMPEANGYVLDLAQIDPDVAQRAKIMWMNYPNNPTGAEIDDDALQQIVTFCLENSIILASDNPYLEITFDDARARSIFAVPGAEGCAIEFLSLSKTYNMAGWRLGAAVGNPELIRWLMLAKSNVDTGHFMPMYDAGAAALRDTPDAWIAERNRVYQERRDRLVAALPRLGLEGQAPAGALYVWARVSNGMGGVEYAEQLLENAHVTLVPGENYGPTGTDFVRFSFCVGVDAIDVAMERAANWYQGT